MASDTSDEERKAPGAVLPAGLGAGGGILIGSLGGAFGSKLANDPVKAADWILDHGASGTLFVIAVALAIVAWHLYTRQTAQEQRHQRALAGKDAQLLKLQQECARELGERDGKYAKKIEELMGRLVDTSKDYIKLGTRTEVALRKLHLMEPDDEEELEEDRSP